MMEETNMLSTSLSEDKEGGGGEVKFLDIPPEIRVKVWKAMNPADRAKMRLLNRQFQREIEEHTTFDVTLDQSYRGFRKLTRLYVESCKITKLTYQNLRHGPLLTFPTKLKKLRLDGNVSRANLLKIFNHCTNIIHFSITHETMGIPDLFHDQRLQKCLQKNLQAVKYFDVQLLRYPVADPFEASTNIDVILSLHFPVLKNFKFCFSLWGNYVMILNFLTKHVSTLQELELQVGDSVDAKNTELFLRSDLSQDRRVREIVDIKILASLKLTKFILRDDVLNTNPTVALYFLEVLEQLTTLKVFQFYSPGEMSMRNMTNIVTNNQASLEEFIVYHVKIPQVPIFNVAQRILIHCFPLDMSIFRQCVHLKTLKLSCNVTDKEDDTERACIKLTNLHLISDSIEKVFLTGFQLDLQEIVDWSKNARNLKELMIADSGPMKYSAVLGCFLRNCSQLKYLNVRPVMTRASDDAGWWSELDELSKLYNHFMNIPFDPIDDLDGFEAKISETDRKWVMENVQSEQIVLL